MYPIRDLVFDGMDRSTFIKTAEVRPPHQTFDRSTVSVMLLR
jgi:hypothetical protein